MTPIPINEVQLNDVMGESVLVITTIVILIAIWVVFRTFKKREWLFPMISMVVFLCGSIIDLLDEFYNLPYWLDEVLEDYASTFGVIFFALGILFILRQVVKLSQIDSLTGIYNRRYFIETLNKELGKAHAAQGQLALAFVDLDGFREINNRFGHAIGDVALLDIALKLKEQIRPNDLLARFGGDEFVILLPNTDRDGGVAFLNQLNQAVKGMRIAGKHRASFSAGLAFYPQDGTDCDRLLSHASKQMYQEREQRSGQRQPGP